MRTFFLTLAQAFGIVMLADFVAGIVHWLEDAYGSEDTPVVGPLLIKPNIVHHHFPRHFTKLSWWQSSWDLLIPGALLLAAGAWWGFLSWQLWLFVLLSVNANQVHKWAHRTRKENGRIVSFFQDIRVLQTPHQHALHHTDPKNTYYCPITNVLNPVLEKIELWPRLERAIEHVTGIKHRHDTSNRGKGPSPQWLAEYRPQRAPIATVAPAAPIAPAAFKTATCDCSTCTIRETCRERHSIRELAAK